MLFPFIKYRRRISRTRGVITAIVFIERINRDGWTPAGDRFIPPRHTPEKVWQDIPADRFVSIRRHWCVFSLDKQAITNICSCSLVQEPWTMPIEYLNGGSFMHRRVSWNHTREKYFRSEYSRLVVYKRVNNINLWRNRMRGIQIRWLIRQPSWITNFFLPSSGRVYLENYLIPLFDIFEESSISAPFGRSVKVKGPRQVCLTDKSIKPWTKIDATIPEIFPTNARRNFRAASIRCTISPVERHHYTVEE